MTLACDCAEEGEPRCRSGRRNVGVLMRLLPGPTRAVSAACRRREAGHGPVRGVWATQFRHAGCRGWRWVCGWGAAGQEWERVGPSNRETRVLPPAPGRWHCCRACGVPGRRRREGTGGCPFTAQELFQSPSGFPCTPTLVPSWDRVLFRRPAVGCRFGRLSSGCQSSGHQ